MAVAKKEIREVVKMVEQVQEVTLVLDKDEAETLLLVLRRISGCPGVSRRKHTQAILYALLDADVNCLDRYVGGDQVSTHGVTGSIFCKDAS